MSKAPDQQDEAKHNREQFELMLATINPELSRIYTTLEETGVNPIVLPAVINAIYEVAYITGHGNITIYIADHKITSIEPKPRMKMDIGVFLKDLEGGDHGKS